MNSIVRINQRLERFPPLVMYAIGAFDAVIIVYVGYLVSKFSY